MAHNTRVTADQNAPPITCILANFVATHPSQGWDRGVEREAHRTLLNWIGCAIGAARATRLIDRCATLFGCAGVGALTELARD